MPADGARAGAPRRVPPLRRHQDGRRIFQLAAQQRSGAGGEVEFDGRVDVGVGEWDQWPLVI